MASLMQSILEKIQQPGSQLTEEECLASLDLDANEIAAVEGGWEIVDAGDITAPAFDDLAKTDFVTDGPPVYERHGYMIVRGMRMGETPIWFVFEPAGTGLH